VARAFVLLTSSSPRSSGDAGSQSGTSTHGRTSCASRNASETYVKRAAPPPAARAVSRKSAIASVRGSPVSMYVPLRSAAMAPASQAARSRASMGADSSASIHAAPPPSVSISKRSAVSQLIDVIILH
jgi:hypothetical protein